MIDDMDMQEALTVPHQLTSHTKLLHKVAIIWQGKVLLLKRSVQALSRPSCWDLPGGNSEWPSAIAEPTENLYQLDIAREILEETGIQVTPNVFDTQALVLFYSFFEPKREIYSIICGWSCSSDKIVSSLAADLQTSVVLSAEHQEFVWATIDELSQYDFGGVSGDFVLEIAKKALEHT